MMTPITDETIPIACVPDAISAADQPRYDDLRQWLEKSRQRVEPLADGFGLKYQPGAETLGKLADFVALESLCCPFLRFEIDVAPGQGGISLRMTGREGVKEFLQAEFGLNR